MLPVDVRLYRSLACEETIIITLTTNIRIASRHERRIPTFSYMTYPVHITVTDSVGLVSHKSGLSFYAGIRSGVYLAFSWCKLEYICTRKSTGPSSIFCGSASPPQNDTPLIFPTPQHPNNQIPIKSTLWILPRTRTLLPNQPAKFLPLPHAGPLLRTPVLLRPVDPYLLPKTPPSHPHHLSLHQAISPMMRLHKLPPGLKLVMSRVGGCM